MSNKLARGERSFLKKSIIAQTKEMESDFLELNGLVLTVFNQVIVCSP